MPNQRDLLNKAQENIRVAFDPELVRASAHRLADLLGDHFHRIEASQEKVLNWEDPQTNIDAAASMLNGWRRSGDADDSLVARFVELVNTMLSRGHNLTDPRYIGHQVPAPVPIAGLFDAVGSVTNQVMAIYEMGPWASAVERAMVEQLGQLIGWQKNEFSGFITHGGSLANLTALLTARNVTLGGSWECGLANGDRQEYLHGTSLEHRGSAKPPGADPSHRLSAGQPVLVAHADAHYCIARSAGILGLGTNQVIRTELDERRRIDPQRLDETLTKLRKQDHPIIAVVACACATPIGAFDSLDEIADVCRKHDVWMHVDAAHGGAASFSSRHRHLVSGLERADSLIWDAHKMLFVPALCAFVFYREKKHRFETFRQEAPYLFDPSAPGLAEFDSGLFTIECTKRAAAFGLWGTWSLFGPQLFADMVDVTFELGHRFYEKLVDAPDFQPLHEPECNIVAFRHLPEALRDAPPDRVGQFQLDLRRNLIQSGEFYIVPTSVDGIGALRVTVINPLTTSDHLEQLMNALRATADSLLDDCHGS